MATTIEIRVPDIGDFDGVDVTEVLVSPGDRVETEQSLVVLESDKASMEVPSPSAGTIVSVAITAGATVKQGDLVATMEVAEEKGSGTRDQRPGTGDQGAGSRDPGAGSEPQIEAAAPATPKAETPSKPAAAPLEPRPSSSGPNPQPPTPTTSLPHASPSIRRFARTLGVDLAGVTGTGPKGRILREDVEGFVKKALASPRAAVSGGGGGLPTQPDVDYSQFGPIEVEALTKINKLTGTNLTRSWLLAPRVTQFDEADITELEAFRKGLAAEADKAGVKLTFLAFLMKAVAFSLRELPRVNASLSADGESLVVKRYIHLGIAVDTPKGLVVPVIRDVDQKGIFELARELTEVSGRAREGKLTPKDFAGASFTITSLGGIGGTQFTPIVNVPEVAILGVSRASMKPVWDGSAFQPRLILPLALSYDHRVVDGAYGVRFTTHLAKVLGDLRRVLL
jgi:pyruvate dehydrogenase E2 component (dihydrolipoamide acetyltransferase)